MTLPGRHPGEDPRRRFWRYVRKCRGEDGCWVWCGASAGLPGAVHYGMFHVASGSSVMRAHAYAWMLANGPVPDGLVLDHMCGVTLCVRPDHLEPVTHQE